MIQCSKKHRRRLKATTSISSLLALGLLSVSNVAHAQTSQDGQAQEGQSAQDSNEVSFEEIVVTATFIAKSGSSGLKSDVPLRDTPMTISGYSSDFMKSIETTRVSDLYNYMVGVQRAGNTGYDIAIRGFASGGADRNSIQIDGLPGLAVRFGSPPTVNAERIEVVKGPASVLYGQVQPGGFVNIISKKPEDEFRATIKGTTEAYYGGQAKLSDTFGTTVSLDVTGPLNDSGNLLYRLVSEYSNRDGFRDNGFGESIYIVPSMTWLASETTSATLSAEYRKEEVALDNFLVAPDNDINLVADITTRYQEPDDQLTEEGGTLAFTLDHDFSENLTWRTSWRSVLHEDTADGLENRAVSSTVVSRRDRDQLNKRRYHFLDTNLTWKVEGDTVSHNILFGANGGQEISDFQRRQYTNAPGADIDIYNPVYDNFTLPDVAPGSWRYITWRSIGAYLQDQISLGEHWKAVAALRYEGYESSEEDKRGVKDLQEESGGRFLPMVGLIYQPDDQWSLYGSYSTSFNPPRPDRVDANGERNFAPETGWQVEAGVKANLLDDALTATLSTFYIEKKNVLNRVSGSVYEQIGGNRSKGFEFETNYSPVENLQIIAGYAYADAIVNADLKAELVGQTLINAPKHTASLWSRYDISEGRFEGLGFGLGVSHASHRFGSNPTTGTRLDLPGYTVVDFGIYYVKEKYTATLKFSNILNERYFESASNNIRVVPGAPASILFSLSVNL